MLVRLQRT